MQINQDLDGEEPAEHAEHAIKVAFSAPMSHPGDWEERNRHITIGNSPNLTVLYFYGHTGLWNLNLKITPLPNLFKQYA